MNSFPGKDLIQTPCPRRWDDMQGSDQRRFCEHCSKHVYNLSSLSRIEVFVLTRLKKGNLCSRLLIKEDGSIRVAKPSQRLRSVLTAAATFFLGLLSLSAATTAVRPEKDKASCKTTVVPPVVAPTDLEMVGEYIYMESSHHSVKDLQKRKRK